MIDMLKNLTKAAVAVAVTPIDLAVDAVLISEDRPLDRTRSRLKQAGDAMDRALGEEKAAKMKRGARAGGGGNDQYAE